MNWTKIAIAGVAGGIVLWLFDFLAHGFLLVGSYTGTLFDVAPANPLKFLLLSLCLTVASAMLFDRTRSSWAAGAAGGATFGLFLGLVLMIPAFYNPLIFNGFAQGLAFSWAIVDLIGAVLVGAVFGVLIPRQ